MANAFFCKSLVNTNGEKENPVKTAKVRANSLLDSNFCECNIWYNGISPSGIKRESIALFTNIIA